MVEYGVGYVLPPNGSERLLSIHHSPSPLINATIESVLHQPEKGHPRGRKPGNKLTVPPQESSTVQARHWRYKRRLEKPCYRGNCDARLCEYLDRVGRQFCSTSELKLIKWQEIFGHLAILSYEECEEHQDRLLNLTIQRDLNEKYPVRRSYQLAFLKHCIAQAERLNIELSRVYELYIQLLNDKRSEEISYKHYFIGDKSLTLRENNNFISGGTTGLCTWQAGIALANWCFCHHQVLSGKRLLELGSGSGLTGIALLHSASLPKEYIFTDCHPLVLQRLRQNLDINFPGIAWPKHLPNTIVDVREFDWGDVSSSTLVDFLNADVILGADIVYDIDLIEILCDVLKKLLNTPDKSAVIACTVRNKDTIDTFVKAIESRSLTITADTSSYPPVIEGSLLSPVYIYLIKK